MSNQTLRGLAKDYAKGVINKESYRKSRSELIKGIIAGDISVKTINYEKPLKPSNEAEEAITEGIIRDKTEIASPNQSSTTKPGKSSPSPVKQNVATAKDKNSSFIFIVISIIIVLSLILAVVLFYPKPPEPSSIVETKNNSTSANNTSTTAVMNTMNEAVAAESLIGNFLNEKNWSEENLDKFVESWTTLTQEERDAVASTKRMQRMKVSIYKQFLEEKALSSIDSEKAIMKQQKLIEFADAIGINDSRLVLD